MEDWTISSESYMMNLVNKTAYSIGAILGDGHMRYIPSYGNGSWYSTELASMDIEIMNRFLYELHSAFGKKYAMFTKILKSNTLFYTVRASSKHIYKFFWYSTSGKQEIPLEIFQSDDSTKRNLVAGLFDTDGTVKFTHSDKGIPRWQLGFANTKLAIVESLASLLSSFNVRVGSVQLTKRGSYRTIYGIHPNIRDFIDAGFYFQASRKQNRLVDYLSHVSGSETMYTASLTKDEDIVQA